MDLFIQCVTYIVSVLVKLWSLVTSYWVLSLAFLFVFLDWVVTLVVNSRSQ